MGTTQLRYNGSFHYSSLSILSQVVGELNRRFLHSPRGAQRIVPYPEFSLWSLSVASQNHNPDSWGWALSWYFLNWLGGSFNKNWLHCLCLCSDPCVSEAWKARPGIQNFPWGSLTHHFSPSAACSLFWYQQWLALNTLNFQKHTACPKPNFTGIFTIPT